MKIVDVNGTQVSIAKGTRVSVIACRPIKTFRQEVFALRNATEEGWAIVTKARVTSGGMERMVVEAERSGLRCFVYAKRLYWSIWAED